MRTTTSSTWASVMVRGTPGRGSSVNPSSRSRRNRARHLLTVLRSTPSRAATATLLPPCAQASTIRARSARPCAVLRRLAQFSNVRRSSSDSTSGSSLVSPIPPADRIRRPGDSPQPRTGTQDDSRGDRELKTGSLGGGQVEDADRLGFQVMGGIRVIQRLGDARHCLHDAAGS